MALQMRWMGEDALDRLAQARVHCYGTGLKDLQRFQEWIRFDGRARPGDFLLAQRDGADVGTATSMSMHLWARGGRVPCQGVAWVGTVRTHRRRARGSERGIASQIMDEVLHIGRERGDVISALMPFRASFYEHFGYGVVERRCTWTVPLTVLPTGDFDGLEVFAPDAGEAPAVRGALAACHQRCVEAGQCAIERTEAGWQLFYKRCEDGFLVVDRDSDGLVRGYIAFTRALENGRETINVTDCVYQDLPALRRQLCFMESLRDQYAVASLTLPVDLPLNWMLREPQIPHRPVSHPTAESRLFTRMQVRILDHERFVSAVHFPPDRRAKVIVSVRETEGRESRFELDYADGRASVAPSSASTEFGCDDRIWAAVACGALTATEAARLGLAEAANEQALRALDVFAIGPAAFSNEGF